MQRRTFLKLAATTTLAAGARLAFPWAAAAANQSVSYAGSLWRAGGAGKIQTSTDAGRTWTLHSNLGDMYSITNLTVRNSRLNLSVGYAGRTFPLVLGQDKRSWLTA
jgi:photosystem II stability/assembly factor-like uncharacterized protein